MIKKIKTIGKKLNRQLNLYIVSKNQQQIIEASKSNKLIFLKPVSRPRPATRRQGTQSEPSGRTPRSFHPCVQRPDRAVCRPSGDAPEDARIGNAHREP